MTPEDLRAWRQRLGWTQARAAAALNMPKLSYCNYEYGRTRIPGPVEALTRYVERYGVLDVA